MKSGHRLTVVLLAAVTQPIFAHETDVPLIEELVVYGRATEQLGKAHAASEGLVGYDDIQLPPLLRAGELVEAVPGMVATQHSGTGKANQYFLRGFNLDHGTDFSAAIEGMPINMRTHGHGQGYLDLNFLIPEMVEYSAYKKGPYAASAGDFSSAGSVAFKLYDRLSSNTVALTAGQDDYYRYLGAGGVDAAGGRLTAAFEGTLYAGPWDLDEELEQYKGVLRYVTNIGDTPTSLTFMGYDGEWASTDQIPRRAVSSGQVGELGFIDPDLGGETSRYSLQGTLDFGGVSVAAYAMTYELALYSDFTYLLDDPDNGDEFEQRDERNVYGITVTGSSAYSLAGLPTTLRWGAEMRYDDIGHVGLFRTMARDRISTVRDDAVEELSIGAWGELETGLTDRLRSVVGCGQIITTSKSTRIWM